MNNCYDLLVRYQKYVLAFAIFLALSSVSITISKEETKLNLANYPVVILGLVALSILLLLIYVYVDKMRISTLSNSILDNSRNHNEDFGLAVNDLTSRQLEVYNLIIDGKSNKEIMSLLFIEQSTLKTHINLIYRKLNIKNRNELKSKAKTVEK